jgi:1,4-dihydroxy-2-naphthoate octaprenyltransferase
MHGHHRAEGKPFTWSWRDEQYRYGWGLALGYKKAYLLMSVLLILSCIFTFWLVLSEQTSVFFLLVASLCAFVLYDVYRTWKGKDHSACFQNIWWRSNKKALVGFGPVLLWWLLHV